jgi:hypothetical protein
LAGLFGTLLLVLAPADSDAIGAPEPAGDIRILNHANLRGFEWDRAVGQASADRSAKASGQEYLGFQAFGRGFRLTLQDNLSLVAPSARKAESDGGTQYRLFKGQLEGQAGSWARLTLIGDQLQGVIWDGETLYSLAPASQVAGELVQPADPAADHVLYRLDDLLVSPGSMSCGVAIEQKADASAAAAYEKLVAELQQSFDPASLGATLELELSAVGDGAFVDSFGADSEAALLSRFNIVDGIFSEQVGVQIRVTEIQLFQPGDPTLSATEAGALLDQLTDLRGSSPALQATGVTHLFTGTDLDGITVGIAYLDALCNSRFGTGLSEARRNQTADALIATHEIGHNFGAPHDGDPDEACASTPETFIMAPSGTGSNQFSACSIEQMQPAINSASCLTALSTVDVSVSHSPTASTGLVTQPIAQTVRVVNGGTNPATNVLLDIDIPANLDLVSSLPSGGSCAPAAGGLSCSFGTLQPAAEATVSLSLRSDSPGSYFLDSSVQADGDDTPGNNTATGRVTIQVAVDLAVSFSGGSVNLTENSTASAALTVANSNVGPASSIALTVDSPVGLAISAANPSAGSCTVTPSRVSCQIPNLAAGASANVSIGVSADQAGTYSLTASVNAAESDLDASDNSTSKSYNVSQQAPGDGGGGGGGGGATSPAWLILGAMAVALRRRRAA